MLRQLHANAWEKDTFSGSDIAFADQPHAIREFRALTNMTPQQYRLAKSANDLTLRSIVAPEITPPEQH